MSVVSGVKFERSPSQIEAFSDNGSILKGCQIWTPRAPSALANPSLVFVRCQVLSGTKDSLICRELNAQANETFTVNVKHAYNCNGDLDVLAYKDIGLIPHKNLPCVLDFLRMRYLKKCIYTFADPLLIVINPFMNLNNTTDEVILKYQTTADLNELAPHVFSIARIAVENLTVFGHSQTIIVSGESGAGKTEASKHIMRYLANTKKENSNTRIQNAVLAANPILEAFGNAKTVRNNNSSRFGRFVRLSVHPSLGIQNGHVQNFLLEKTRVFQQDRDERGYHIFYQLIKGASPEQREKYHLLPLKDYKILNPFCHDVPHLNDVQDWKDVISAFDYLNFSEEEIDFVFSTLSGILLLGNVKIVGGDIAHLSEETSEAFHRLCQLLHLDEKMVEEGICVKLSVAGNDVIRGYWSQEDAEVLKQSFGKAIYEQLFYWLVARLNTTIAPTNGFKNFIGMLDIFGFEVFDTNSLEQLFINITNEMLQNVFIEIVFEKEKALYTSEGISTHDLVWTSNGEIINLLTGRSRSLMSSLEDQCIAPGGTDEKFVSLAYKSIKGSHFLPGKVSPNLSFIVVHTIGPVQYSAKNFLQKNKDILRSELVQLVQNSSNQLVRELFKEIAVQRGKLAKGQLNGSKFFNQLKDLIQCIRETEAHFIRCVKPNEKKAPLVFDVSKVVVQLSALSVMEALQLRNLGYSYRRPFAGFVTQFRFLDLGISETERDPMVATKKLLEKAKTDPKDYIIGRTMVFIKHYAVNQLMRRQREVVAGWDPVVTLLEAMILKKKFNESIEGMIPGLKRFQANVRKLIYS